MKRISALCSVLVILLAALALISPSLWADQPLDDPKPKREWGEDLVVELPQLPESERVAQSTREEGQALLGSYDSFAGWSKLAFQSLRDGNWEIYVANGAGNNAVRLTSDPATDVYPHLNRGTTRIAFASNRDGDYEIYTANLSGGDLRQLTFNGATDTRPAWSPDGTKIAFQSYRDGIVEIYVMNADGSGQMRLTTDGAGSIHPSWSPDGAKIAFASLRSGTHAIWTMNPNGTGLQQIGAAVPYAEHPVWSADGSKIAFDGDNDGDEFFELFQMNANGSNLVVVHDPSGQTDAWAASWSPSIYGVKYVAITEISFIYYQGNWYWTAAYLRARNPDCNWCAVDPLGATDVDWQPNWQTSDTQPPVTSLHSRPQFSRCTEGVPVSWSVNDLGAIKSSPLYFETQYREEAGSWQPWLTTTVQSAVYYGTCGTNITFRVRARDAADNLSAWTSDSNSTWLYTYVLSGEVNDNRGTNVPQASVSLSPTAVVTVTSDVFGMYRAYSRFGDTHIVTATKSGYSHPLAMSVTLFSDVSASHILPPMDNQIQNGNFESLTLTNTWHISGNPAPAPIESLKHTGRYAIKLGMPFSMTVPRPVLQGAFMSFALGNQGGAHLAATTLTNIRLYRK